MNELEAILHAADSCDEPLFLATVVDVVGSSYRRPGARMLILPGGRHVGAISGGCLERDLCRQAATICTDGPKLISFDTRNESTNLNARYNLGCSGIIYVLVEPVTRDASCPLEVVRQVVTTATSQTIGTVYESSGSGVLKLADRVTDNDSANLLGLRDSFERVATNRNPICCQLLHEDDRSTRIFVECISPPKPLWIFGGGDDAMALTRIATETGWAVTVVDDRPRNLTRERFSSAERCSLSPESATKQLTASDDTAAILMTHNFAKDAILLPWLCASEASYIGLLGPKSRTGKLLKSLHADGKLPPFERLEQLHTPVGLDIGATNPAEIAIAITAEIIAKDNQRQGSFLSQQSSPIHSPVAHELIEVPAIHEVEGTIGK